MVDPELRFQAMLSKIQEKGTRLTSHRLAFLRLLAVSEGHPSAMEIYEKLRVQFPTISLATVYKTLALLKEKGEVLEIDLPTDNHYDGNNPHPHPHLICVHCKSILDGDDVVSIQAINQQISEKFGFTVQKPQLVFYGICADCDNKPS